MNVSDILILLAVAALAVAALCIMRRKKTGCGCGCAGCTAECPARKESGKDHPSVSQKADSSPDRGA